MRKAWLMLIFIAALFLGVDMVKNPGYAVFVYQNYMVQLPLWLAFIFFITVLILVIGVTRFFCGVFFLKKILRLQKLERYFKK